MAFTIHKVTALPATLEGNALYFVLPNGTDINAEAWITNSAGVAKGFGNTPMIQAIVNASLAAQNSVELVPDITARDALTLTSNALVTVVDASGDPTVTTGAALYIWDNANSTYQKLSEFESMDVVLDWANLQNGPASTPALIDAAVAATHTHANKVEIDKIGEASGVPTYDSVPLVTWATTDW